MLHFSLVCSALLMLAWLGTFLSGLFLLYVATLFVVMLPASTGRLTEKCVMKDIRLLFFRRGLLEKHCGAAVAKLRETMKGKKME